MAWTPSWPSNREVAGCLRSCWRGGISALGSLVFPWTCPICERGSEGELAPFCIDCRAELLGAAGAACPRCAMPVGSWGVRPEGCGECRGRRQPGFDAAVALGPYQGPIRDLCLRLKHEPEGWIAPWLGKLLVDARPILQEEAAKAAGAWVVPIPLHWSRRWARGYNQSDGLARGVARRLGLRVFHPLRRVRSTAILAGQGRAERAKSMRGAFGVRGTPDLKGRTVFLVDDILTTGATCAAAARVLKRAGATRVVAVVIGRAEGRL